MKQELAITLALSVLFLVAGAQIAATNASEKEISTSNSTPKEYFGMGATYLEKGFLYLGIAGLLIAIWLLLNYKV